MKIFITIWSNDRLLLNFQLLLYFFLKQSIKRVPKKGQKRKLGRWQFWKKIIKKKLHSPKEQCQKPTWDVRLTCLVTFDSLSLKRCWTKESYVSLIEASGSWKVCFRAKWCWQLGGCINLAGWQRLFHKEKKCGR